MCGFILRNFLPRHSHSYRASSSILSQSPETRGAPKKYEYTLGLSSRSGILSPRSAFPRAICFTEHCHWSIAVALPRLYIKRFIYRESPRHRRGGADSHSCQTYPLCFLFNSYLQEFLIHTVFYALNSQHTEKSHTKLHQAKHY